MGFPDDYTLIDKCTITQRYQAIGNSWAVPVIKWIFNRILNYPSLEEIQPELKPILNKDGVALFLMPDFTPNGRTFINSTTRCYNYIRTSMLDIVENNANMALFLSPAACGGILRREKVLNGRINDRLKILLEQGATNTHE